MKLYESPPAERAEALAAEPTAAGPCLPILLRVPRLAPEPSTQPAAHNLGAPSLAKAALLGLVIAATVGLWLLRWHTWLWPERSPATVAARQLEPGTGSGAGGPRAPRLTAEPLPDAAGRPAARLGTSIVPVDGGGSP